jgi:hypothetical protein
MVLDEGRVKPFVAVMGMRKKAAAVEEENFIVTTIYFLLLRFRFVG